jgi:hypothetical protein
VSYGTVAEARPGRPGGCAGTVAYATLLTGIAAAWTTLVLTRTPFEANVSRAPGTLFTLDEDGYVRNTYILRITNNDAAAGAMPFHVSVE